MKKKSLQLNLEFKPVSRSYILRLWCADPSKTAIWRASLEDSRTGERFGFSSLEMLFAFLMDMSEMESGSNPRCG